MQLPYSLLVGPLRPATRPQRIWFWPQPADQSLPDRPRLTQYTFRPGGFWQLLNRASLYPTPADQSVPDRSIVPQYKFRPGGYWQLLNRPALYPAPAAPAIGNQTPLIAYVFRPGGLWQTSKFALFPQLTDPVVIIPPPPPPPSPPTPGRMGGELGHVISDTWQGVGWQPSWLWALPEKDYEPVLLALLASGAITEEEFMALLAAMATAN